MHIKDEVFENRYIVTGMRLLAIITTKIAKRNFAK